MAASGELNPGWFGNPGSTTIYPLAFIYHSWHLLIYDGLVLQPDANLQLRFEERFWEFYLLGRLLSVSYGLLSLPLLYFVGRRAFGQRVGLMGAALFILYWRPVFWAQHVRTDSSALFFGLLSLWLLLKFYDWPTSFNRTLACLAIGLSIASRYFMVALVPTFLLTTFFVAWLYESWHERVKALLRHTIWGLLTIVIAFALSTPYFFLDSATVIENLRFEARTTHPGADGLSPLGNLLWYLSDAIPLTISWPQSIVVALGVLLVLWHRQVKPFILLAFAVTFLIVISLPALHWPRWLIQAIPIFAILVAFVLHRAVIYLARHSKFIAHHKNLAYLLFLALISISPAYDITLFALQGTNPSTRILAREWAVEHLPSDSKVVVDINTVPLDDTAFIVYKYSWTQPTRPLEDYVNEGYDYIFITMSLYERFLSDPEQYREKLDFYESLFESAQLLHEVAPSLTRYGSAVRIYQLPRQ